MELDMEIGEGQPQGCPFFWGGDGSDDFGESTLPVCLQSQTPGISQAVPLSSRKNAKGGGQSAQLAFGSDKCRLSSNAFSCEPRGSQAPCTKRPCPKTHRRCALAVWKIAYQRGVLTGARRSYVLESEGLKSRSISKISKIRWIACWWFKGEGLRAGRKM